MKIASTRKYLLLLLGATASSSVALNIGDILGIDCESTSSISDLAACADKALKSWLEDVGDYLDVECLKTAGTDWDLLNDCAAETASASLSKLGEITGIDCLTGSTELSVLEECASEQLGSVAECFDTSDTVEGVVKCANETIDGVFGILDEVPDCVETTLQALSTCAENNADACSGDCGDVSLSPLNALSYNEFTCTGLQTGLMTPLCGIASCCTPCVADMEAFARCVANDVLELSDTTDEECALSCPATNTDSEPEVQDVDVAAKEGGGAVDPDLLAVCGTDIQGERRTLETMETMMDCTAKGYVNTIQQNASENSSASRWTGVAGMSVFAIVAFAAGML